VASQQENGGACLQRTVLPAATASPRCPATG